MGAKGSVEAAKMNADNWGHLEVCIRMSQHLSVHIKIDSSSTSCLHSFISFVSPFLSTIGDYLKKFFIYANSRYGNLFLEVLRMENLFVYIGKCLRQRAFICIRISF